ncbi:amino acid adenylation domain-containing protein [Pendulispora albinea]|uniref:Amino acid adenylation domain-containing protein n=1 Tax=Pendulispora albinea TaxID=2741071 RepID=A0ABZ2M844_9BACT
MQDEAMGQQLHENAAAPFHDGATFFQRLLAGVEEPTAPFGVLEARADGRDLGRARRAVEPGLARRLRKEAQRLGVSAASILHLAWALVLARVSGRDDVVFGTATKRIRTQLPVRIALADASARATVKQMHQLLSDLRRHPHAPPAPPFSSRLELGALDGDARPPCPLIVSLEAVGRGFVLTVQAQAPIDPELASASMVTAISQLVRTLEHAPEKAIQTVDVLPRSERRRVLHAWNATHSDYPHDACIHELFEAQVARTPDVVALVHGDSRLTYSELNQRANRLAHRLRQLGVGPDDRVALCAERSVAMVVALLAILKAGGAYVPLDPSYPPERLASMLRDSTPKVLLTHAGVALDAAAREAAWPVLNMDAPEEACSHLSSENPRRDITGLTARHLAYVIYTSGSTGKPKGVMNEHRSVVNRLIWMQRAYGLQAHDTVLQKTPFSFDVSVWEFFWPLLAGAKLVMARPHGHKDPAYLAEVIQQEEITTLHFVPSMLNTFLEHADASRCQGLTRVVCSGEALAASSVERFRERLPSTRLYNLYGPTEAAVDVTAWDCTAHSSSSAIIPIGRPISNARIYILNSRREPCPAGVTGELYIGGVPVARGYLGKPELTAERFLIDPFVDEPEARMYRTGDVARWLSDGNIEFLGRNDDQVKIRGFRIELGEIEARILLYPGVGETVVLAREDAAGEKRLVAYFTATRHLSVRDLREHLSATLPDYMVPAAYVRLASLPLTPNGKLDRRALPAPDAGAYGIRPHEAPQGEVESILAELWSELLQRERIGRHDHFFELGGHSLMGVALTEKMRRRGLKGSVRALFAAPTLAQFAAVVGRRAASIEVPPNGIPESCQAITPEMLPLVALAPNEIARVVGRVAGGASNVQDIYPLAPLQEGILFHHLLATDGDPYVVSMTFRFDDRPSLERYLQALQAVMARHDILRTAIVWEGVSEPVQVVWRQAALPVEELELGPSDGVAAERMHRRVDPHRQRLDLEKAPLLRAYIARDTVREGWLLLLLTHHLVLDHNTLEVMHEEVTAYLSGQTSRLSAPVPFRNFIAQTRLGVNRAEHESFFRHLLEGIEEPTVPFGMSEVRGDGRGIAEADRKLAPDLARRLRQTARRLGVSAAAVFHLAWAQLVARTSGRDDVVFGTVLLGRLSGGDAAMRAVGLFINTLPIRITLDETGVEAGVQRVHKGLADLLHHEHASLALAQRCSRVPARTPLFSSLLNYRHSPEVPESARQTVHGIEMLHWEERTNYPLLMQVDDLGQGFALNAQAQAPIDPEHVCDLMVAAISALVDALERAPQTSLRNVDLLPAPERHRIVHEWNATSAAYPVEACIHELFEAEVARTPDAIALVHGPTSLTYAELNRRANRLAHHLRRLGVRPDDRVALCAARGLAMVVGVLAVLKAGAGYVPLDPSYPPERLAFMLRDSAPKVLLTQRDSGAFGLLADDPLPVVDIGIDAAELAPDLPEDNLDRATVGLTSRNLAYVIYTSGSTGQPKGVMVEHRSVTRLFVVPFGDADDVWTLFTSLSFDVSVWELWGALLRGARLIVVSHEQTRSPDDLYRLICDEEVTVLSQPPSAFRHFMAAQAASPRAHALRTVIVGGEALDRTTVERWHAQNPGKCPRLINGYGPTEATVWATWYDCQAAQAMPPPIGRPISNTRVYILGRDGEPVPRGVAGELYIGGAAIARGYLHRPELTAQRFLKDPFAGEPGARMYRTGDIGRWLPDGNIEYLGRNDDQVKIRGFRIELGEIEARLASYPGVREAAVRARQDVPGDTRLVAYYTAAEPVVVAELRAHMSRTLPDYMVPAAYVHMPSMPLTPNGKLDRGRLPSPDAKAYTARAYEAPRGEVEPILAQLWSELLHRDRVGRHDNFFELGGHSLMAVALVERMRRRGFTASVPALFAASTLSELAATVEQKALPLVVPPNLIPNDCRAIAPEMLPLVALTPAEIEHVVGCVAGGAANVQDIYPLAPLQEGILFHHLLATGVDPYVASLTFAFEERAKLESYLRAMQAVLDRHDILRTAVIWEGVPEPVQVVWRRAVLPVENVELDPRDGDAVEQLHRRTASSRQRLDLRKAPLLRAYIARDPVPSGRSRWLLLLVTHHLVMDHLTLQVMHQEVTAHLSGRTHQLSASIPFRDFVAQTRLGVSRAEHEAFFQGLLGDVDEPTAPFGLLDVHGDPAGITEAHHELEPELARRLRAVARGLGVSAATLFHVAWAQVLARATDRDDVVFGTVLLGRMLAGEDALRAVGLFINTLPVRIAIDDTGVAAKVRRMHERLADLLHHEHASLAVAQRCSGVAAPTPLFSSLLNYRHGRGDAPREAPKDETEIEALRTDGQGSIHYPLIVSVDELERGFRITVEVQAPIEPEQVCSSMVAALSELVDALERAPEKAIRTLDVLPARERHRVLHEWNASAEYPAEACIHELFEAEVARTPDAIALVHGSMSLTYSELNRRANRLAHHLRRLGVRPDDRVALCAARGLAMVVGVVAVLKAGAAYVPLDPSYPPERLAFMLRDSAPKVLLTQTGLGLEEWLTDSPVPVVDIDAVALAPGLSEDNLDPAEVGLTARHLAYVIYTSGSTGQPKGVMVEHQNVVRLFAATAETVQFRADDVWTLFTSSSFDVSVWELWGALLHGARAIVVPHELTHSPRDFHRLVCEEGVTLLDLPPSVLRHVLAAGASSPNAHRLRMVFVGGEALDRGTIESWHAQNAEKRAPLINCYGPTETTITASWYTCPETAPVNPPIGRPIPTARIYILGRDGRPVPVGAAGELYIGGAAVARGYLHRPELTAERFLKDPFVRDPEARMYRTGDIGRWLPDGNIEFLGRNDDQVKIRGFRVELGEVEARLRALPGLREAVVLVREDVPGDKRLVAYYTAAEPAPAEALRAHLASGLPDHMVPAAYVHLEALPLTANGLKVDRHRLPAPGALAYTSRRYEAPQGEVESILAELWSESLHREGVGRHDNFFELGGHSLTAVTLMEKMRRRGLTASVRSLFAASTLSEFAAAVGREAPPVVVPPNAIPSDCPLITPAMLPLVALTAAEIERLVAGVDGGARNVQDIYPLAPLQEGILFHHLMATQGDPYVRSFGLGFADRTSLESYLRAVQAVIDRHDILRTAVVWEGVSEPVQIVWRRAVLPVEEVELEPSEEEATERLFRRVGPRTRPLDLEKAPLLRAYVARDTARDRWSLLLVTHHLVLDNLTMEVLSAEVEAHLSGQAERLSEPLPFRHLVAHARLGVSRAEHEAFFRRLLGDVDEPTAPFGLLEVRGDGSAHFREARQVLEPDLAAQLRQAARRLGVSAASLFHLAWARVLARVSGRDDVVFGTVLLGRALESDGAAHAMGVFINTLPVRIAIDETAVDTSARRVHTQLADLLHHEHASLALAQRCSGVAAPTPLFSSLLNYLHGQGRSNVELRTVHSDGYSNYPLTLSVDDLGEGFALTAQVQNPIEPDRVCGAMIAALSALAFALERSPEKTVRSLDVLPASERRRVLYEWNTRETGDPHDRCIHELFEAEVARMPDAIAVVQGASTWTYAELNRLSNRLARHLRQLGVGPDVLVASYVSRGPAMVIGLLAVLKAGGAYIPLDPAYPPERLAFMLRDSAPKVLLTCAGLSVDALSPREDMPVLDLDLPEPPWSDLEADNLEGTRVGSTPRHLAYVIYTSGSTGQPKGVMVEHRSVCNLVHWHGRTFGVGPGCRTSMVAGLGFDAAAWELWSGLCSGATIRLAPDEHADDPDALLGWWQEQELDIAFLPTPLAEMAISEQKLPRGLKALLIGGDRLRSPLGRTLPFALVNNYGPTETTVVATSGRVDAGHAVHIGRPIANTRVYILDAHGEPAPVGAAGELYIGGAGVARGYLNRPELTAERFRDDPFAREPGARMYRTGDIGRWLPNGNIEFLGRNDHQVKIRGFRIELGEIEARLRSYPGMRDVVVLAREHESGDKRLIAYYTAQEPAEVEDLREYMSAGLPSYMVPAAYLHLEAFPLTANGKLDARALPAPDLRAYASRGYEAPRGEVETILAGLWSELLQREQVGRRDNFFELGGHSLMAVTLMERLRRRGLAANVRSLFATSTLAELAAEIGSSGATAVIPPNAIPNDGSSRITPEMLPLVALTAPEIEQVVGTVTGGAPNVQDIYPLTPLQEGVLFHHALATEGDPYSFSVTLHFEHRAKLEGYLRATRAVIARHDILRTAVVWEGISEPVQVVWRQAVLPVEEVELKSANGDIAEQLYRWVDPRRHKPDLQKAPLLRAYVSRDGDRGGWVLLLLMHQLVMDHSAVAVMDEEVEAHLLGHPERLHPPIPFRNFVAQGRLGVSRAEHEAFFRELLNGVDGPTAPFGLLDVRGNGRGLDEARTALAPELALRLREAARRLRVSAASIIHLAWARVLARTSGRRDVVFGTVLLGRMLGAEGMDRAVGVFLNTLPVRIRIDETGAEASVLHMQQLLADLLHHEHAPLALAQRCSEVAAPTPLFSALLNYRHTPETLDPSPAWHGIETVHVEERTNYPLMLSVDDRGRGFNLTAQVRAPIEPDLICELMISVLSELVDALEQAPAKAVETLNALPPKERHRVLREWNAADSVYPHDLCIHEGFEARAARTPDAIAVVHGTSRSTYSELNRRANRLARHLRSLGVRPDDRVAVCAARSVSMVVALLAVLKAGGAYVPLDPSSPAPRLRGMLRDSAPKALLTQASLSAFGLTDGACPVLDLEAPKPPWSELSADNLDRAEVGLTRDHLAYVMYTSGSTGEPKGVMYEHGGVVNRLAWMQHADALQSHDTVLQKTPFTFDVSVWELFWPLTAGAKVVLAHAEGHRDAAYLVDTIRKERVTTVHFVPSMLPMFLDQPGAGSCTSLTRVVCSGEALPASIVDRVYATWPNARLSNQYGPTESGEVTAWPCTADGGRSSIPIGRPISNARIYILDERGEPVPTGVAGELYIGGVAVARGYLHRPELTAERFSKDPFVAESEARMYRTGDIGRWLPDGNIEFLGRNDDQIKIRGFRIEPREIETRLLSYPGVRDAVVTMREDAPGDARLVAYYVADEHLSVMELRAHLSRTLPEHMVPAAYVHLETLPLGPHGKRDRRVLPAPDAQAYATRKYEVPQGEVESALAAIWSELLNRAPLGRCDNFFDLGAHSLLILRAVSALQRARLPVTLRDVFEHPTVAGLAELLSVR